MYVGGEFTRSIMLMLRLKGRIVLGKSSRNIMAIWRMKTARKECGSDGTRGSIVITDFLTHWITGLYANKNFCDWKTAQMSTNEIRTAPKKRALDGYAYLHGYFNGEIRGSTKRQRTEYSGGW